MLPKKLYKVASAVTQRGPMLGCSSIAHSLPACRRQGEAPPARLVQQLSLVWQVMESILSMPIPVLYMFQGLLITQSTAWTGCPSTREDH